jgi:hypothetical protein
MQTALELDRAEPRRLRYGFGPSLRVQLVEQGADMEFDGVN